jgi:hypothetical protein
VLGNLKNQAIQFLKSFKAIRANNQNYSPTLRVDGIVATGDQFIANDTNDANVNFQAFFATVAKNNADLVVHLLKYIP